MHFMKYLSLQKFIAAKFEGSAECLSARGDLGLHSTSCKGPFQVASGSPLWCAESLSAAFRKHPPYTARPLARLPRRRHGSNPGH